MYRRLTIGTTVVDLPESGLTYSLVYEVSDEGFVSGAYSKRSVDLPSTGTNDALFEDWYAAGTDNTQTAAILKPFVFEDGGINILAGQCELQSGVLMSDRYRFKGRSYKVDLYGNNADWTIRLKDVFLRDLAFADVIYDTAAVLSGWTAEYDNGDYHGFTLIKWKEWNVPGEVGIDEFTPFLFIRSIIDKAFDLIGYTIQSDFLNSDVFKRLILPLPMVERYPEQFSSDYINVRLKEPGTTLEYYNPSPPYFVTPYVFPSYQQPILTNPYNSTSGFYVVPFTGYYQVELSVDIVSTGTHLSFFQAVINGNPTNLIPNSDLIFGGLFGAYSGSVSGARISDVVYLQAGDTISLALANQEVPPGQNVTTWTFSMNIIGEAEFAFGSILAFQYLVKDWNFLDLIKGLKHMFNLRFEANPQAQTIRIEPADAYLYQQNEAPTTVTKEVREGFYIIPTTNSTQSLDLQREGELFNVTNVPTVTNFEYITDSETEKVREGNNPIGIYGSQYTLPPQRFNDKTENNENPFFAKTIHTNDSTVQGTTATFPLQIPLIYPTNYELDPTATEINADIQARILYFVGWRNDVVTDSKFVSTFGGAVDVSPPLSFMVNYNNPLEFSLSFATEIVQNIEVFGLFESFWMQEYARKRIGKRLECYYFWDLLTINSLSFRNKLLIDGNEWVLQKIDGYSAQSDSSTKTFLVLEQYPTAQDLNYTQFSNIIGIVNPLA
jgi:hypothetical protein